MKITIRDYIRVNSELLNTWSSASHGWKSVDEFQAVMMKKKWLNPVKIENGVRVNHVIDGLYQEVTLN